MVNNKVLCAVLVLLYTMHCSILAAEQKQLTDHEQWLKKQFSQQHRALMPVVAVADIFFSCNKQNKFGSGKYSLETLITKMNKTELARKLDTCLAGHSVSSVVAINYGLLGCFQDQFQSLPATERENRLKAVSKAITSLSIEEKKKSFTQCVTDQSIKYLN